MKRSSSPFCVAEVDTAVLVRDGVGVVFFRSRFTVVAVLEPCGGVAHLSLRFRTRLPVCEPRSLRSRGLQARCSSSTHRKGGKSTGSGAHGVQRGAACGSQGMARQFPVTGGEESGGIGTGRTSGNGREWS